MHWGGLTSVAVNTRKCVKEIRLTALRWKSVSDTHVFLEFFSWPKYLQNNEQTTYTTNYLVKPDSHNTVKASDIICNTSETMSSA